MEFLYVPIIVLLCYLIGDIYKAIVKKDKEKYKYIPLIVTVSGGLLGLLFYYIAPDLILNVENPVIAIVVGIISGAASTGSNQIVKQIVTGSRKKDNTNNDQ